LTWHRSNARTAFRHIADSAGRIVAGCPSYADGPSVEEAQANAELILSGTDSGRGTPGPWRAVAGFDPYAWLIHDGPNRVIVAMVPARPDARLIAETIVLAGPERRRPAPIPR
jgi:hypothetical protein